MSQTGHLNIINLQVRAEDQMEIDKANGVYDENRAGDDDYYLWHGEQQTIPFGMDDDPVGYAKALKASLPEVNALRLPFNFYSFNEDGTLHEQYEQFLVAAAEEGFQIIFGYFDGEAQRYGWDNPDLTKDDIIDALDGSIYERMTDGWSLMLDWLDDNPSVKAQTYGLELVNEPATYERAVRRNGNSEEAHQELMTLYAEHMGGLQTLIEDRFDGKTLVGGWNYSAQFKVLNNTTVTWNGQDMSALDAIRDAIGEDLVWSAHNYPGWHGAQNLNTIEEYEDLLVDLYSWLEGDDVIITETHAHGATVDDIGLIGGHQHLASRNYEWYADNGIGIAWFPGAETGASHLVSVDGQKETYKYLHQNSLAHAMNVYSMDERPEDFKGDDTITSTIHEAELRNEGAIVDGQPQKTYDDVIGAGFGFGYEGNDTITGHDDVNDFLYGGFGDDTLHGQGAEDFLFGQDGDDTLYGGDDNDMLFGGRGNDRLIGGKGEDQLEGAQGNDTFVAGEDTDIIRDFNKEEDSFELNGILYTYEDILGMAQAIDYRGAGATNDLVITHDKGQVIFLNMLSLKPGEVYDPNSQPDEDTLFIEGTDNDDVITLDYQDGQGTSYADTSIAAGREGSDKIMAPDTGATLYGGLGRDTLYGGAGDDVLYGNEDNDRIYANGGNDKIFGGDGNDTIILDAQFTGLAQADLGNDRFILFGDETTHYAVDGNSGRDKFEINDSSLTGGTIEILNFDVEHDTIVYNGTVYDFTAPADNTIVTPLNTPDYAGWEITTATGATIQVQTPPLPPEPTPLTLIGTEGDDVFSRHLGQVSDLGDTVITHGGDDSLFLGNGDDYVESGDGRDIIEAGDGNDTIYAGADNDEIKSQGGDDIIYGGDGNDRITINLGYNIVDAGRNNDRVLVSLSQSDGGLITLGEGKDRLELFGHEDQSTSTFIVTDFNLDEDTLYLGGPIDWENPPEGVTFSVQDNDTHILTPGGAIIILQNTIPQALAVEKIIGTDEQDRLYATRMPSILEGKDGNDFLHGYDGDDILYGGNGGDQLFGGLGNDLLYGGAGNDKIVLTHGEDVAYGGDNNDRFEMLDTNQEIFGGNGNDRITISLRDGGNAFATGGDGKDSYIVHGDHNTTVYISDFNEEKDSLQVGSHLLDLSTLDGVDAFINGSDTVLTFANTTFILEDIVISKLFVPTPDPDQTITGSDEKDYLVGENGNDVIEGLNGDDKLIGGQGEDILFGGSGRDLLEMGHGENDCAYGGEGNDRFVLYGGTSTAYGGDGNDRFQIKTTDDAKLTLYGGNDKDRFEFNVLDQNTTGETFLADFDTNLDTIKINKDVYSYQDLLDANKIDITDQGPQLTLDDGHTIFFDFDLIV